MPKVLVSDSLAKEGIAVLEAAGLEVLNSPGLKPAQLHAALADADALVIRSGTQADAAALAAGPRLRVVGRAGIGVDNVDVPKATERGIVVMNTPEGNNITTAEHAISLLVSLARHVPQATASLKGGKWEKKKFQGMELNGRVLGVVGLGHIGRIVARLGRGLGMRVVASDPFISEEMAKELEVELVSFDDLLPRADAITVHVPRTEETTGLLGAAAFARCREGVLIINAARGGIVDEEALHAALESGRVGGAALDVFVQEPPPAEHPLLAHPRVICTPHLGASTATAQRNVAVQVCEQVRDYLQKGVVRNAVNLPSVPPELLETLRPYLALGEKLGRFQGRLAPGVIEEIEIEYSGEVAELRTAAITVAVLKGMLESVSAGVNMVNAPHIAKQRGIRVVEAKRPRALDFASAITTRVRGGLDRLIAGALFHGGQPRIVRVDDFMLEAIPEGPTLLLHNLDAPGVVGAVGACLGAAGINISRMQVALIRERNEAAMIVNVDPMPDAAVMKKLRNIENMIVAQLVDLK